MLDSSLNMYCQLLAGVPKDYQWQVQNILYKFLTNDLTYQQAASQSYSLIGTSDPIDKIVMITNVPEDPHSMEVFNQVASSSSVSTAKKSKTWTPFEDQRLLAAIHKYGLLDWNKISEFVGNGRSRSQCVQRWSRSLNPLINKTQWSPEEDARLLKLVNKFGKRSWTKISNEINGRTDVQCRYRYQIIMKRENKEQQLRSSSSPSSVDSPAQSSIELSPQTTPLFNAAPVFELGNFEFPDLQTQSAVKESQTNILDICSEMQFFDLLDEVSVDPFASFSF